MTSKNLILGLAALAAVGLFAIPAQAGGKPGKVRIGFQVNVGTAPHRSGRADRGRHEWREQRVWVPGRYEVKWVERRQPNRYEWQTVSVKLPDRHEWRTERAWVPGSVTFREERYPPSSRLLGHPVRRPSPAAHPASVDTAAVRFAPDSDGTTRPLGGTARPRDDSRRLPARKETGLRSG